MRCSRELPGSATLPCLRLAIFKKNFKLELRLLPSILPRPSLVIYFKLLAKGHKRKESNKELGAEVVTPGRAEVDCPAANFLSDHPAGLSDRNGARLRSSPSLRGREPSRAEAAACWMGVGGGRSGISTVQPARALRRA